MAYILGDCAGYIPEEVFFVPALRSNLWHMVPKSPSFIYNVTMKARVSNKEDAEYETIFGPRDFDISEQISSGEIYYTYDNEPQYTYPTVALQPINFRKYIITSCPCGKPYIDCKIILTYEEQLDAGTAYFDLRLNPATTFTHDRVREITRNGVVSTF